MEEEPREVTSGFVSKKSLREGKLASYARLGNANPRLHRHKLTNITPRTSPCTQRSCVFAGSTRISALCDTSQGADQRLDTHLSVRSWMAISLVIPISTPSPGAAVPDADCDGDCGASRGGGADCDVAKHSSLAAFCLYSPIR